ncbi:ABC transporter substrate-binding protein [Staphylococcus muscae]|uniref:Oligopeptide ABC transporter oligopeptide-binding protein n=1 Tax=Staphylococcus muscae TaxID=1294 RepID=A0A240C3X7_9STAP|nr:oligopeptide ABC transporter substrate-binding protein [Staphylococcus muscae]AVQ33000.1 ABC transporter substrate-binding protein [Staphylococcus muscae]PNZ02564.1 ABC transporter substrate-binding protein [Staphylococcus muscae]GGA89138.1 peptide ABC transporter substrate-binding protein [Staphylococcus muscae]SNW02322.1 oligopeptide ABC transporter oligopeptide-binding protein [Staphylococcus muscae]
MNKRWRSISILFICLVFVLAACGKGDSNSGDNKSKTEKSDAKGGTLNVGIAEPPQGDFQSIFAGSKGDDDVINFFNDSLVDFDDELNIKPKIISWEQKKDDKLTYTFKMKKGIKWQDGNPLTINDWIFTLETLADPDYDGPRYDYVEGVKGAEAKRKGEADTIEGIKKIDDYTMELTFKENKANNLLNLWTSAVISEKIFKDIPVKDMAKSPEVRKNPIGIGPYKVKSIVDGESVTLEKFDDYWQGEPKLDKVNLRVVEQTSMAQALESGEIDMSTLSPPVAKEISDNGAENLSLLKAPSTSYTIVGFVLNDYDKKTQTIGKERPKYQDKKLRQAMAHAINRKEWIEAFYYGYGKPLSGLIPSAHWSGAGKDDVHTYEYDVKKAEKLLDEAGYKDKDGDGWREDKDGKPFVINLKHYAGSNPTFEPRTAALKGYWEKVGLKTKTEMVEFGKFGEDLENAEKDMEVYVRTWVQGADPDLSGLYKSNALWNESRYNNEKADKLLEDAVDGDVVGEDKDKRKEKYLEWQKTMAEDVPVIPIVELEDVTAVSSKVKNFEVSLRGTNPIYEWTVEE